MKTYFEFELKNGIRVRRCQSGDEPELTEALAEEANAFIEAALSALANPTAAEAAAAAAAAYIRWAEARRLALEADRG